jgi:hypothetical protein
VRSISSIGFTDVSETVTTSISVAIFVPKSVEPLYAYHVVSSAFTNGNKIFPTSHTYHVDAHIAKYHIVWSHVGAVIDDNTIHDKSTSHVFVITIVNVHVHDGKIV